MTIPHPEAPAHRQDAPHVLVGVDGSPGCRAALAWALEEAAARRCGVHVVAAYPLATGWRDGLGPHSDSGEHLAGDTRRRAWELVADVRSTPGLLATGEVAVEVAAVPGEAAEQLARLSAAAELLVVGSRGRSALASTVLGSVALRCIAAAECPVVVVPGMATAAGRDRVVAGFDGSAESLAAVEEAVRAAVRRGWPEVEVVSTFALGDHWTEVYALGDTDRVDIAQGVRERVSAAVEDLLERVGEEIGPLPAVTTTVLEGRPDDVLRGLARNARLLAVGSRGRGALVGALLGSVAFSCVVGAHGPTLVVPARAAARQAPRQAVGHA